MKISILFSGDWDSLNIFVDVIQIHSKIFFFIMKK